MTDHEKCLHRVNAYYNAHLDQLELLAKMWDDPKVQCYDDRDMPSKDDLALGSIFLAGPTSRHQILEYNWRCQAVAHLREAGFQGMIYVPEPRGQGERGDFTDKGVIHYWESDRLFGPDMETGATHKVVWIPRNADELLGLNTNHEFGIIIGMIAAGKATQLFVGWPAEAERMGLPNHYSAVLQGMKVHDTLRRLCFAVVDKAPPEDIGNIPS